jgi:hypothetical protein
MACPALLNGATCRYDGQPQCASNWANSTCSSCKWGYYGSSSCTGKCSAYHLCTRLRSGKHVIAERAGYAPCQGVNVYHITKQEDDVIAVLLELTQTPLVNANVTLSLSR